KSHRRSRSRSGPTSPAGKVTDAPLRARPRPCPRGPARPDPGGHRRRDRGLVQRQPTLAVPAVPEEAVHRQSQRPRQHRLVALDPRAALTRVVAATDAVATDLNTVLGRDDARARILFSVARRTKAQPRVR